MSKKTLLILGGIFIGLAIAASSSWWSRYIGFLQKPYMNAEIDFAAFTQEATEKIAITKNGEEEKIISKENGIWKIAGFDASSKTMEEFFAKLTKLKVESLVSKNPDNYANFGVGDDAYILSLTKAGQTSSFIIGNRGPSFNSFYARKKGGTNVYLIVGSISDMLSQNISAWRDKTVARVPKEAIQKIEIISKTKPIVITKTKDNKWQAEGFGKTVILEENVANRLLAAFDPLEAVDFLTDAQAKEFQNSNNKVIVNIYDNEQKLLVGLQFLKKENDWWAQVNKKDTLYKIPSYKLSDVFLSEDIFNK